MKIVVLLFAVLLAASGARAENWNSPDEVERFITKLRDTHGFDEGYLRNLLESLTPHPAVLKAIAPPSHPTQVSWHRYRARFLTAKRIRGGIDFWDEHAATLARAERQYGVPAAIIVGIIGVETEYGHNTGSFDVLQALATLAFAYPPRADFFRSELEQFMLLTRENGLDARTVKGSYAGALGIPQFMPGSQRSFAVDFDGNGKVDLSGSSEDAIGSVAAFLARHGWVTGGAVAQPAVLSGLPPENWLKAGVKPSLTRQEATQADALLPAGPEQEKLALVDLVSPEAPTEYWWGHENFYVITRYNRSRFYAMSVFQLAEAVASARQTGALPVEAKPKTKTKSKAGSRGKRRRGG